MTKATYTKKGLLGLMDSEEWSIGARSHGNKQQAWWPQKQAKRPHFQASNREGTPEVSKAVKSQRLPAVLCFLQAASPWSLFTQHRHWVPNAQIHESLKGISHSNSHNHVNVCLPVVFQAFEQRSYQNRFYNYATQNNSTQILNSLFLKFRNLSIRHLC